MSRPRKGKRPGHGDRGSVKTGQVPNGQRTRGIGEPMHIPGARSSVAVRMWLGEGKRHSFNCRRNRREIRGACNEMAMIERSPGMNQRAGGDGLTDARSDSNPRDGTLTKVCDNPARM